MKKGYAIVPVAFLVVAAAWATVGAGAPIPGATCSIKLTPEQERMVREAEGGNVEITLTEEQLEALRRIFPHVVVDKITISQRHLRGTQRGGCEIVLSSGDGITMEPQPMEGEGP